MCQSNLEQFDHQHTRPKLKVHSFTARILDIPNHGSTMIINMVVASIHTTSTGIDCETMYSSKQNVETHLCMLLVIYTYERVDLSSYSFAYISVMMWLKVKSRGDCFSGDAHICIKEIYTRYTMWQEVWFRCLVGHGVHRNHRLLLLL